MKTMVWGLREKRWRHGRKFCKSDFLGMPHPTALVEEHSTTDTIHNPPEQDGRIRTLRKVSWTKVVDKDLKLHLC